MAGFSSDSGSEYSLDLTASDEEQLWAAVDRLAPVSPRSHPGPVAPATPVSWTNSSTRTPARNPIASSPLSPNLDPDATLAIEEIIAAITDDDLSFDISELQEEEEDQDEDDEDGADNHGQGAAHIHDGSSGSTDDRRKRRLAPSVSGRDGNLASFVSKTKPRSMATLLPGPDVSYPDREWFPALRSP